MKLKYLILVFCVAIVGNAQNKKIAQIENIISRLTLEEKAGQLNLIPISEKPTEEHLKMIREGKVGSILKSNGVAQNRKLQKIAVEESTSGIPILFQEDVIHGYKTIAPIPLAESASWDLEAIRKSAAVAAREAAAAGIHLTYAPMVDIARDPRWGRILEGAGEDPYLGSKVAEARVKGFQEDGQKTHQNILSCVKHFVGYGASLAGRDYNILDFSERELRETHLPPFQAAIDAGTASLMCAYSAYDGVPLTANRFLLKDVLRDEMHFDGLVMTDWATVDNLVKTGISKDYKEAAALAISSGIDMDMSSKKFVKHLPELVRKGIVSEELLNNAVRKVLVLKQKADLLDNPYKYFNGEREKSELLSVENLKATKDIALKSMVLLKNKENILPINKKVKKIAVIGPLAKSKKDLLGWWSCKGDSEDVISIYNGLEAEFSDNTSFVYAQGCTIDKFKKAGKEHIEEAVQIASGADVVIMVLGEQEWMSGEGGGTASLHLPSYQEELIAEVSKTGKPIITVIVSGRPYILTQVAKYSDALLQAWMPGTLGGEAVSEILSGKFNPQGKLPVTFPYHEGQIPIFYSYRRTSHPFDAGKKNNRYSTTHRDIPSEPLYPFGYGLSYTKYEYSDIDLSSNTLTKSKSLTATITITNIGDRKGKEVVQLYIQDKVCSVTRPLKELKNFSIVELEAGQKKKVSFEISIKDLMFIDRDYKKAVEAGEFILFIGANSNELKKVSFSFVE